MPVIARHLRITGRVQGVSYRQWLIGEAGRLGLSGWVRNRPDGSVEAVAQGPADAVAALVARARTGPAAAKVETVTATDRPVEPLAGFSRRPTG